MKTNVQKIVNQVKDLPENDFKEFLSWLAEYEMEHFDEWDKEIERDSQPGGRLESVLKRVRKDITEGRTEPLNEVINDS